MFPFPTCPLAGQSEFGQNSSCGFIGFSRDVVIQEFANEPRFLQDLHHLTTLYWGGTTCFPAVIFETYLWIN